MGEMREMLGVLILIGGLAGIGVGAALPFVFLGMRDAREKREQRHAERMRLIELGVRPPSDFPESLADVGSVADQVPTRDPSSLVGQFLSVPCWVAFWGFLFGAPFARGNAPHWYGAAFLATLGTIALGSIAGAAWVGSSRGTRPRRPVSGSPGWSKPIADPDAYDTVSRRG